MTNSNLLIQIIATNADRIYNTLIQTYPREPQLDNLLREMQEIKPGKLIYNKKLLSKATKENNYSQVMGRLITESSDGMENTTIYVEDFGGNLILWQNPDLRSIIEQPFDWDDWYQEAKQRHQI